MRNIEICPYFQACVSIGSLAYGESLLDRLQMQVLSENLLFLIIEELDKAYRPLERVLASPMEVVRNFFKVVRTTEPVYAEVVVVYPKEEQFAIKMYQNVPARILPVRDTPSVFTPRLLYLLRLSNSNRSLSVSC